MYSIVSIECELSSVLAALKRTNHFECIRQCGSSDFALKSLLHPVERSDDPQRAPLALRLQRQQISPRISRIDFSLQQAFGFERRDGMADVASRSREGRSQVRRL